MAHATFIGRMEDSPTPHHPNASKIGIIGSNPTASANTNLELIEATKTQSFATFATRNATPQALPMDMHEAFGHPKELAKRSIFAGEIAFFQRRGRIRSW